MGKSFYYLGLKKLKIFREYISNMMELFISAGFKGERNIINMEFKAVELLIKKYKVKE